MASTVQRLEAPLSDPINRRSSPRVSVLVARASVRKISEQPAEASLEDLSIYGCRIRSPLDHTAGERVWLRFAGTSPIHATVVWSDKGFLGCRFNVPIANSLFRALTLEATPQLKIADIKRQSDNPRAIVALSPMVVQEHILPETSSEAMELALLEVAISTRWNAQPRNRPATARIADLIEELVIRQNPGNSYNVRAVPFLLTQYNLADATDLPAIHVNRTLRQLRMLNLFQSTA